MNRFPWIKYDGALSCRFSPELYFDDVNRFFPDALLRVWCWWFVMLKLYTYLSDRTQKRLPLSLGDVAIMWSCCMYCADCCSILELILCGIYVLCCFCISHPSLEIWFTYSVSHMWYMCCLFQLYKYGFLFGSISLYIYIRLIQNIVWR
jgi:hypothetical protein